MRTTTFPDSNPAIHLERQARHSLRRIFFVIAALLLAIVATGYLGISAYAADKLSRPERIALTSKPSDLGLKYDDVVFTSTMDSILLSGWYIDSPGDKVVMMLHGRNGRRDGGDALEIASKLAAHDYDVFMFDFRAHGASGASDSRWASGKCVTLRARSTTSRQEG